MADESDEQEHDDVGRRLGLTETDPQELTYQGPGAAAGEASALPPLETELPGGLDPNVAAYGSGGGGVLLMTLTAWIRRRRSRRELGRD